MKDNHYIPIIIVIILLIGSIFLIQSTLAKYRKKVDQDIGISLAKWNIKLNDESIANKSTISGNVTPVFDKSDYVADNVVAPGVQGYFDIDIDATEVDVTFTYKLNVTTNEEETYPDIVAYEYSVNGEENKQPYDKEQGITGTIQHNTDSTSIRVYIKWDDSETSSMTNPEDTALAINNSEITMNAEFLFEQLNVTE